jgi:hypothetical protein
MMPQSGAQDLQRELQATLSARRELGPEYDDQFIARLTDQIAARVRQEVAAAPRTRPAALSAGQRTAIAICSLLFGIPLVAIAGGIGGSVGLVVAFVALVLINLSVNAGWGR